MPKNLSKSPPPLIQRIQNARFFSVSLVIHLVLGVFLGGVVLFKSARDNNFFVASTDGTFFAPTEEMEMPAESFSESEFDEPASAQEALENPAVMQTSAIASLTETPATFEIAGYSDVQTPGLMFSNSPVGALTGSGSGSGGSGKGGGGRMKMGSFFGTPAAENSEGLMGVFYDLKQTRTRRANGMHPGLYGQEILEFARTWRDSKFREYYKAPQQLVSAQIFMPHMRAELGPKAFGVENEVQPSMWAAVYRAKVSPPKTGTYHFVGAGDDIMFVRFDGKMVLDRCWYLRENLAEAVGNYTYGFFAIRDGFAKGPAFRAEAGKYYDLEVLIGEQPGGYFFACLMIEEEGADYDKDFRGNPVLPIFRVAEAEIPALVGDQALPPYAKDGPIWKVLPFTGR